MKRNPKKVLTVATVAAGMLGMATVASAVSISGTDKTNAALVTGFVTVHDDTTTWALKVTDIRGEGYGAYAKIVIDRDDHSDNELRSGKTSEEGDTVSFTGKRKYSRTRGAKIYACVDRQHESDSCTEIDHVKED